MLLASGTAAADDSEDAEERVREPGRERDIEIGEDGHDQEAVRSSGYNRRGSKDSQLR